MTIGPMRCGIVSWVTMHSKCRRLVLSSPYVPDYFGRKVINVHAMNLDRNDRATIRQRLERDHGIRVSDTIFEDVLGSMNTLIIGV